MYIKINRESKEPIKRQCYSALRGMILEGQLHAHTKLLSSRRMAQENGVSRVVVLEAYEQLISEGYLYSKSGSGTYVSQLDLDAWKKREMAPIDTMNDEGKGLKIEGKQYKVDFRTGAPDLSLFPIDQWGMIYRQVCRDLHISELDYYNPCGSQVLVRALLGYLYRTRGIVAKTSQVVITTGAAQAFTLLSRLLLTKEDCVVVEDPINRDIHSMLTRTGASIQTLPVDHLGIRIEDLEDGMKAKLIFTTPSHQFPMGSILSIHRRMALIKVANRSNGYIIEDDYDSDFRFRGTPINAMHTLDPDRVIYTGTFSKILFPALRIGYVILPEALVEDFSYSKHLEDLHTPILEQVTLARFIEEGHLDRHIHHCRKVYKEKNAYLQKCLKEAFGKGVSILGDEAGIHMVAEFTDVTFHMEDYQAMAASGLHISSIEPLTQFPKTHSHHLMLGYGHLSLEDISEGVDLLETYIETKALLT